MNRATARVDGMLDQIKEESRPTGLIADLDRTLDSLTHLSNLVSGLENALRPVLIEEVEGGDAEGKLSVMPETQAQRQVEQLDNVIRGINRTVNRLIDGVRL